MRPSRSEKLRCAASHPTSSRDTWSCAPGGQAGQAGQPSRRQWDLKEQGGEAAEAAAAKAASRQPGSKALLKPCKQLQSIARAPARLIARLSLIHQPAPTWYASSPRASSCLSRSALRSTCVCSRASSFSHLRTTRACSWGQGPGSSGPGGSGLCSGPACNKSSPRKARSKGRRTSQSGPAAA